MKKIAFLLTLLIMTTGLFAQEQSVTVSGKVINNTGFKQISLKNLLQKQIVATADIQSDGSFTLTTSLKYPDYFALQLNDQNYVLLVLQPGDKVQVTYDAKYPAKSEVKGAPLMKALEDKYKADDEINKEYQECQKKLQQRQYDLYKQVILNNLGQISALLIAERLPMDQYLDVHIKLAKSLEKYKANPYVQQYIKNVNAYAKTGIGTTAPDIALPNPDGDTIRLSSLRGKYVLVDFWAAWCRPCRAESPNLVKAYEKYHDKGFTIYSISLDNNRQQWVNAIKQDGIGLWYHVSDLRGWRSSAAQEYGVSAIPANFLLDPEGKIIAKNLRGEQLQQKLEEIFNKK